MDGIKDVLVANIREYIHDQKHFTSRWLRQIKTQTGTDADVEMIAQCIVGATSLLLVRGDQSQFVCNFICIVVPLILTYIYPKERPKFNLLLVYWATFSGITLLDNGLSIAIPAYYIFKLCGMACMFLKPICGAQKILEMIEKSKLCCDLEDGEQHNGFNEEELTALQKARVRKSPPPEKPEGEDLSKTGKTESTVKSVKSFTSTKSKGSKDKRELSRNESKTKDTSSVKTVKEASPSPSLSSTSVTDTPVPTPIPEVKSDRPQESQPPSPPVKTAEEIPSVRKKSEPAKVDVPPPPPPVKQPSPPKPAPVSPARDEVPVSPKAEPQISHLPPAPAKPASESKVGDDSTRATSVYVKMQAEGGGAYAKDEPVKVSKSKKKKTLTPLAENPSPVPSTPTKKLDDSSRQTASTYVKLQSEGGNSISAAKSKTDIKTAKSNDDSSRQTASTYQLLPSEGGGAYAKNLPASSSTSNTNIKTAKKNDDSSRQTASTYQLLPSEGGGAYAKNPPVASSTSNTNIKTAKKNDDSSRQTASTYQLLPSEGGGAYAKNTSKTDVKTAKSNDDSSRQTASTYQLLPSEGGGAYAKNTPAKSTSKPSKPKKSKNNNNTSTEDVSMETQTSTESGIPGEVNPDDLVFTPKKQIVFNGPFNDNSLTYHMTLKNNSKKWIGYAIKSNAVPRISCVPTSGILKPNEKATVAVNVDKFNVNDNSYSKDRISFEYVFCPPDTKAFTHQLLQSNEVRRRKNIKIVYNA